MKESKEGKDVRQNVPYTATRKHEVNLRRNRTLHFQIGLILTLIAAISLIELKTPVLAAHVPITLDDEPREYALEVALYVEPTKPEKVMKQSEPEPDLSTAEEVPDDTELLNEFVDLPTQDDTTPTVDLDIGKVTVVDDPDGGEIPVDVPFHRIEEVPVYPGCEGLATNEERKDCLTAKIHKLVGRKFNPDVGADAGLSGPTRISVQFRIDKNGDVTQVLSRAQHPNLEKEAERVVNLIPKMTPGKQRNVPVGVIYNLPIRLNIE
jgi:protein TonB